jgi:CheY-like chemotaxis protein
LNLLSNAIKFTGEGRIGFNVHSLAGSPDLAAPSGSASRATARTESGPADRDANRVDTLRFTITDTGVGIKPEARASLFQSFTQADSSTTRRFGGTGLGLAISKRLAELMGGRIGYESELNVGSQFWVDLPLEVNQSEEETNQIDAPDLKGRRVLIVDESPVSRQIARQTLETHGVEVLVAGRADQALELIEQTVSGSQLDAALLGFQLAPMDGLALARLIRALDHSQDIVLLLLTANRNIVDSAEVRNLGFAGELVKPLRRSALLKALSLALAGRPPNSAPAKPPTSRTEPLNTQLRVLLAEDNFANQKLAKAMLERLGCQVDVVMNGMEAIRASTQRQFDMILMDCQMPEIDGYSATVTIRTVEARRGVHTPIIALTASAMKGDRERCLAAGMDDYLTKPLALETLAAALARWQTAPSPEPRV